jgi:L-alanine-DL-glutamate epimerase-like enolase superfamily enzyme
MRITGYEVFTVANPTPHIGGPVWMFVRLDSDTGHSGYGEIFTSSVFSPPATFAQVIGEFIREFAVGEDPRRVERFMQRVYNSHYTRSNDLQKAAVASGVEIAMWDLVGKSYGVPVHQLLGGRVRDSIRMYSYLSAPADLAPEQHEAFWEDDAAITAQAAAFRSRGFTAVKLDPFPILTGGDSLHGQYVPVQPTRGQLARAERILAAVRAGLGDDADLIVGTHGQFTAAGAVRVAEVIAPFDPLWFEEPVPPESPSEMGAVARSIRLPIAAGERLASKAGFAELIRNDAADVFNFDVTQLGGLLEAKKVAALAEANDRQVSPHVFGGPLVAAASLQFALTVPNLLIMEGNGVYDGFYAELLDTPLDWRDGRLHPNDRPGMGHDLDEELARAHAAAPDAGFQYRRPARDFL